MDSDTTSELCFARHGAEIFSGALRSEVDELSDILAHLPSDQAGIRLWGIPALSPFLCADGPIGAMAVRALGLSTRAVRAILFDKTVETNWSLGWHQDRTICVRERVEVDGFGPWTMKQGMQHVAPPFSLLARDGDLARPSRSRVARECAITDRARFPP